MASKKVVLSADETTATVAPATVGDIFTTALSMNEAVTGAYGVAQKLLIGAGGAMIQNVRLGRGVNIFKSANTF